MDWKDAQLSFEQQDISAQAGQLVALGAAAYPYGNTSSRKITIVKQ